MTTCLGKRVISALAWLMAVTIITASPVDVRSATNCPSPEDVAARLRPLLPDEAGQADGPDVAHIEVGVVQAGGAKQLHLLLVRADASVVGDRRLLMRGTCQDMADTVATVIAAWETRPMPEVVADVASAPVVKVIRAPSQVPAPRLASTRIRPLRILLGASAGAAFVGGVAAAGGLEVSLGGSASHWQWRLGMASETTRQLGLLAGQVHWQHTAAALGVGWRAIDPSWLISLDAGPAAGWATLAGSNFAVNRRRRSFEYGVAAGLRAGRTFGRYAVWAEWRTNLWAQGQRATITGADSGAQLPQVDMAVGLGISALFLH
jgi:hypothetical protein